MEFLCRSHRPKRRDGTKATRSDLSGLRQKIGTVHRFGQLQPDDMPASDVHVTPAGICAVRPPASVAARHIGRLDLATAASNCAFCTVAIANL